MRSGKLRQSLALQSQTEVQDASGQSEQTWATYTTVWGSVEPLSGNARLTASAVDPTLTHLVRIRYSADVASLSATHRISWDSRILQIVSVMNREERNREIELLCREAAA